jgi:preprotein translocase subunit YajC
MGLLLILLLFVLFWAFLIRPKQREMKRHQELVASIEVGDEVMTGSGFYGVVTQMEDDAVFIELAPGVEVKVARRAVAAKVPDGAGALPGIEQDEDIVDAELVEEDEIEVIEPLEDVEPHHPDLDANPDEPDEGGPEGRPR